MLIWTIKQDEPLPLPQDGGRIMRCGIISQMLADRGHDVIWWSSDYSHQMKKRFFDEYTEVKIAPNYTLNLLHAKTVYKKHVSLRRFRYLKQLAREFLRRAEHMPKPDLIYCSYPSIDFAYAAVKFGNKHGIPTVVDIRDLWPDIFVQPFPKVLQPLVRLGFCRETAHAKYAITNASKVIAAVPAFIEWAKGKGRVVREGDEAVYFGYSAQKHSDDSICEADIYWRNLGVTKDKFVVSYFGMINETVGLDKIVNAARCIKDESIRFVISGDGNYLEHLKTMAAGLDNIVFTGYIDNCKVQQLMRASKIGMITTNPKADFFDAVPNKAIEYMAGGLIVLSTLPGHLKDIIEKNKAGFYISDVSSIISIIERLFEDDALAAEMRQNAEMTYHKYFRADKVYGDLCLKMEDLARNGR